MAKYPKVKKEYLHDIDELINFYISKIHHLKVIGFRNDYAAHTQRKKIQEVLTDEEVIQFIQQATDGEIENLFSWIYPKDYNSIEKEKSLMGVIMLAKTRLLEKS